MTTEAPPYMPAHARIDELLVRLVRAQQGPWKPLARVTLYLLGIDIDPLVKIGKRFHLIHSTVGVVIHYQTVIGDDVIIYHGVTVGRADPWRPAVAGGPHAVIGDQAVLCAGAAVVVKDGQTLEVGDGTIVGANAVLTRSTGDWEIWAGSPARKVGDRPRD